MNDAPEVSDAAQSIAEMVAAWYTWPYRNHIPARLIQNRLNRFAPSPTDERVKALVSLLCEAREDLASYVDADYPETSRAKYPDIQRRWHRDMELCSRIDAALRDMGVAE